jgi:hypothetical protein
MKSFTLDTNCLIDLEDDNRPAKEHVLALIAAADAGKIRLSMVESAASERQLGGGYLNTIEEFNERVHQLGLGSIELLKPILKCNFSFWNNAIWGSEEMSARQNELFRQLFPEHSPVWSEYAASQGVQVEDHSSRAYINWRNKICDAQTFWAHEHYGRDHFVTSDGNFLAKLELKGRVPKGTILTPKEAAQLITK